MIKVSVIVPVYNVQEYLGKCLSSLTAQTLKDIEIICVDDGSTDDSLAILQHFAAKDKRIKVINKKNGGVSSARNAGLEAAKGKYVMFVDGDDWIEPETCEECYEKIVADDADLLVFNFRNVFPDERKIKVSHRIDQLPPFQVCKFNECPNEFFSIASSVWGKLFRLNSELQFKNLKKAQDTVYYWEYCLRYNPKITVLNEILYNYVHREGSTMNNDKYVSDCLTLDSVYEVMGLKEFKESDRRLQAMILNRYALSLCWEIENSVIKLSRTYSRRMKSFISLAKTYSKDYEMPFYKKLKIAVFKKKHSFLSKNIIIRELSRHYLIKIFGLKLKIKRRCGRQSMMQRYIELIRKNHKKYSKDCYLLFDNLIDETAEAIDAYSLFEQMRIQNIPAYYVVRKQSILYRRLEEENRLENIIALSFSPRTHPNEFMQKIYEILLHTKCVVTSFGNNFGSIDIFFKRHRSWQYIFIQHGTIFMKESVLYNGYLYPEKFDKFLVCSDREQKLFLKYGFPAEKLIKVGLPRWDLLHNLPTPEEKSILLMMTWRHLNAVTFETSLYKKNLFKLLSNVKLKQHLKKSNIKVYFAPHHALSGLMDVEFDLSKEKMIEVVDASKVSQYIRQCSCLITDFSSVAFDFMFQYKPVIFYMLDKNDKILDRYDEEDLEKFDYKQYILPDVYFEEDDVVNRIIEYCENNFKTDGATQKIYDSFFYTKKDIRKQLIDKLEQVLR